MQQCQSCVFGPFWCWKCTFPCHLSSARLGLQITAQGLWQLICACTACMSSRSLKKQGLASVLAVLLGTALTLSGASEAGTFLQAVAPAIYQQGMLCFSESKVESRPGETPTKRLQHPQKSRPEYLPRTSRDTQRWLVDAFARCWSARLSSSLEPHMWTVLPCNPNTDSPPRAGYIGRRARGRQARPWVSAAARSRARWAWRSGATGTSTPPARTGMSSWTWAPGPSPRCATRGAYVGMGYVQACEGELQVLVQHFWSLTLCTQWPLYRMLIRAWLVIWRAWSWAGTIGVLKLLLHSLSSAWDAEGVPRFAITVSACAMRRWCCAGTRRSPASMRRSRWCSCRARRSWMTPTTWPS